MIFYYIFHYKINKGITYKCGVGVIENQMENYTNKYKNSMSKNYTIHVI